MNIFLKIMSFIPIIIFIVLSLIIWIKPPKPNKLFGFRTKITLNNEIAWNEVNKKYSITNFFVSLGILIVNIFLIIYEPLRLEYVVIISLFIQFLGIFLVAIIFLVWHQKKFGIKKNEKINK